MFSHKRLSLAKQRRRLTGKALAERSGLTPVTISRLEKGDNEPDEGSVAKLADALEYPVDFFYQDDPDELDTSAISFRSLSKMSAKERDAALSAGALGLQLEGWVEDNFSLPKVELIDLSYETDPETAARSLREHWGIGERPIGNMIKLLEAHGVRIFSLSENTASVDAFSFWRDDKPFVFLNNFKTAERSIFDTAHELGHLVLHRHGGPQPSRSAEREADRFASSFLMPAHDVRARMPNIINANVIIAAKARWRVSAMAMAYRCHTLNLLTDWQYKSLCIELGKRGYRSGEPQGIERETSVLWHKILSQLWAEKTTKADIAASLNLPLDELEGLMWQLAGPTHRPEPGNPSRHLRAVK